MPEADAMSLSLLLWIVVPMLLVFWAVGAYNRLVRLRGDLVQAFSRLAVVIEQRFTAIEAAARAVPDGGQAHAPVGIVLAAVAQARVACEAMRPRPADPKRAAALTLARRTLDSALASLVEPPERVELAQLIADLRPVDGVRRDELKAREAFNAAVLAYNDAIAMFPALLLAHLFSFRRAGALDA